MAILELILVAIWAMLPAYIPNNAAVLAGGGSPIDGGRRWRGKRILGDGKTWRGTAAGITTGALLALALNRVAPTAILGVTTPHFPVAAILSLPAGAMAGDIAGSFVKRRLGTDRGAPVPGIDQLDFVIGALLLTVIAAPGWFSRTFTLPVIGVVFVITPVLHVLTNVIGYVIGQKQEPW